MASRWGVLRGASGTATDVSLHVLCEAVLIEFSLYQRRGSLCAKVAAYWRIVCFLEDLGAEGSRHSELASGALANQAVVFQHILLCVLCALPPFHLVLIGGGSWPPNAVSTSVK